MKKYIVMKEEIRCMSDRKITEYRFFTLFFAIKKAKKIGREIGKEFRSQDRVFIKKGKEYYNPNRKWNIGFGMTWTIYE